MMMANQCEDEGTQDETHPQPGIRTRLFLTERVPSSNALTRLGAALVLSNLCKQAQALQ